MEGSEDEYGSFSHTGFSLAYNVHSKDSLWDAFVLNFRGMFESAVYDCTEAFGFEDKVFES